MFLSTTFMMFLSTAYLCLKGPSGLPSLLPTRECLDLAKQKNRRVRLLCKGLEHFRDALYPEPMVVAAGKKDQSAPSTAVPVAEATADKEPSVSANTTPNQATRSSVKKPCTFYPTDWWRVKLRADGGEIFKPLFPAKKTPPISPGSVASSSTAVEPLSRKVSPSGSDIKDFAYPSSEKNHVLDPTAIIEENTKKQLLKQLKKTAEKEDRVAKLAAENAALNAELTSANATARNRDAQTDLAKTYANAMILSNVVLRQAVLDIGHQVRSGNDDDPKGEALQKHLRIMDAVSVGAHRGMARLEDHSAGQSQLEDIQNHNTTEENQPKVRVEESEVQLPNTVANLNNAKPANRTALNKNKKYKQQRIKNEGHSAEETMEQGEKSAVDKGQGDLHTATTTSEDSVLGNIESKSSGGDMVLGASRESSFPLKVENLITESDGDGAATQKPTEDALTTYNDVQGKDSITGCGISAIYEFPEPAGPATMWGILQSDETVPAMDAEGDNGEPNDVQGAISNGQDDINVTYEFPEPAGAATLWGILQSNQTMGEFDTEGNQNETTTTQEPISDGKLGQDKDGGSGENVSASYEFSEPAGPESNQKTEEKGPKGDHDNDHNDVQGTNGGKNTTYELLEPAGPATLWGILQSNQTTEETGPEGDHDDHNDVQGTNGDTNTTYEFLEPVGPATLWGILQSNQTTEGSDPESEHIKDTAAEDPIAGGTNVFDFPVANAEDSGCEGGVTQDYDFSEPSGAATLWGILHSNHGEFPDTNGPVTLPGTLQSSQCEEVEHNSAPTVGEPGLPSDSNESPTIQGPVAQGPDFREPKVEELITKPAQEEDYTQSKADAGEKAAPEAGSPAPQAKTFYFDGSEIDVIGAQGRLDEPQGVSEIKVPTDQEDALMTTETTRDELGNDEKSAEQSTEIAVVLDIQSKGNQGTEIAVVLDIQSEGNQSTTLQGQDDSGLIELPLDNGSLVSLDKDIDLSQPNCPEEGIAVPAASADTSGTSDVRDSDDIGGEVHHSDHSGISPEPARTQSLPEPEVFDFPCPVPKPSSVAKSKAEKKKAEHQRYKAKKKAEMRRLKEEEEEEEMAVVVEAPEPPKTLAQSQAEEDAKLGNRRLAQQAKRQEQQDRAASMRGFVRSSRAHLIY